jgi:hypothetical protein
MYTERAEQGIGALTSRSRIALAGLCKVTAAALAGAAALVALWHCNPAGTFAFPPCLFHAITGLHCPGCGTLRGLHQLLHGHPWAAFRYNPLMVLSLPLIAGWLGRWSLRVCGFELPHARIPSRLLWGLVVVVVAYGIARNVPLYPFCLLAPTGVN